jgi:two-component system, HptB-dependent secretion and biofilm response regulator
VLAVAMATLDHSGSVIEANAGFLRLIGLDGSRHEGMRVDHVFIAPDFPTLLARPPGHDGEIHRGRLVVSDCQGQSRSLRARVWRVGGQLRILAEHDVDKLGSATSCDELERMQEQLLRAQTELQNLHQADEDEQRIAAHLMQQLARLDTLCDPLLDYWIQPARNLSGDMVAAARTPGGVLHVMLADGTGHGLAASLNVLPIVDPFYEMTQRGCSVGTIVTELNTKLNHLLPIGRFVAATVIAYDPFERLIEVWTGGVPAPFVLDNAGRLIYEFANLNVPLGVARGSAFDPRTQLLHFDKPCRVIICSDGATEAERSDGTPFGRDRLIQALRNRTGEDPFGDLKSSLNAHLGGNIANDDISIVSVSCVRETTEDVTKGGANDEALGPTADGGWTLKTVLTAEELKYVNAVPLLLGFIQQFQGMQSHSTQIFLVLSELFNNALDHGLLGLDSRLKEQPGGMEHYLDVRTRRLAKLRSGSIEIAVRMTTQDSRAAFEIRIKDSGPGFDYQRLLAGDSGITLAPHGRGITLIRSLCESVEYRGCGNEVKAQYRVS